jgi:hypothetical protein
MKKNPEAEVAARESSECITPWQLSEKLVSYIKHVLQPGETIRYQGSVHWILYLPAIVLALVAAAIAVVSLMVSWQ